MCEIEAHRCAEESKEIPRAVGRLVVVYREDDAAVSELSGATCCAGAGAARPVPQAHVGPQEQGEQTGDEGWLGVAFRASAFISLVDGVWAALSSGEVQDFFARADPPVERSSFAC